MSLTTRLLSPGEWGAITDPETVEALPLLNPEKTLVFAVEDEGVLVGHCMAVTVLHGECFWIAPAYRRQGGVARRLLRAVKSAAAEGRHSWLVMGTRKPDVRSLIVERLGGAPVSMEQFVVSARG